jgi:hypothetical protein
MGIGFNTICNSETGDVLYEYFKVDKTYIFGNEEKSSIGARTEFSMVY